MIFIELPIFTRCTEMLFSDEDLRGFQNTILENPLVGTVIPGSKGLRKLRVPLPGRGKRGGARVIYYHWHSKECCYLVYAYAKNEASDLTQDQLKQLAAVIEVEIHHE
ncbi:Toxin HigB-2 [Crenothrix polyspora]|jgi:hypothetical protein|uniref:Toxin HigB-2 n=1 Tax=Crenothrix polyspora TaxID=360316 RepID=A0A1R4HBK9_9GAMM|nr:type II toxin-antitoxin system RelE/ParE family toxin [Crenothrix polyspora]SJM93567.1 Toxin HigB-2 [Crenothrix polyspora]